MQSPRDPSRTVCVVDSDESTAPALRQLMCGSKAEVLAFSSAEDLLDSALLPEVGCVVTDAHLPGLSGLELQRRLHQVAPGLPVIFLAARSDIPTAVAAVRGGAVDFFEKPWLGPAIARRIRHVLNDDEHRTTAGSETSGRGETPMAPYKHLLVTTDFSEAALAGVKEAARLAEVTGAGVTLLYVIEDRLPPLIDAKTRRMVMRQHKEHAGNNLARHAEEHLTGCDYEVLIEVGRPDEAIARVAEEQKVDLVVMGSQGHTAFSQAFLGSTTQRTVRRTSTPVLVVQ